MPRFASFPVRFALAGICCGVLLSGCGDSMPKTVPVHGKVTFQGKPVSVGRVTFQPVKPAEGYSNRPATGAIQSDGTFEMSSFAPGDGVVPGEYRVGINTRTGGPTPENPAAPEIWATPKRYGRAEQSGLKATVPAKARSPLEMCFELEE